jgi:hypothetical protein
MTILIKTIHNAQTGETKEIPLTAEEIAELQAAKEADEKRKIARQAEAEAKAEAKAALLDRLGITADEAKLLLS